MKSYLFLIAWFDGSESSGGEKTKVHKEEDLYKQFKKGNENVFAVLISVNDSHPPIRLPEPEEPFETVATHAGEAAAFHANYTAHDSTSNLIKVDSYVQKVIDRITPEMLKKVTVYL